jgi:monoamine oxidase
MEQTATTAAPSAWVAEDPRVSEGPGVLTASYTWENNARYMASLSEDERTDYVVRELDRLHPGLSKHIEAVEHIVWDDVPGTGGGAFAYYAPGEHSRYLAALGDPHPAADPRVFIAGEHVSVVHAWIQGAVQSAVQAVLDIAERAAAVPHLGLGADQHGR